MQRDSYQRIFKDTKPFSRLTDYELPKQEQLSPRSLQLDQALRVKTLNHLQYNENSHNPKVLEGLRQLSVI